MERVLALAKRRPVIAAVWTLALLAAIVQVSRLSVFMFDAHRPSASILPTNDFFCEHTCLSSFTEAARFAREGNTNVYDPRAYLAAGCEDVFRCGERSIGPLKVDIYQYPPTFLLLPVMMRAVTTNFFVIRFVWFVIQVALLLAATLLLARWIGGRTGQVAAALSVVLWISPSTLVGIQVGNFQATAFALTVLGMLALNTIHRPAGGVAVGFATASKLYPGVLLMYLAGRNDWRRLMWIAAGGVATTLAALALVGTRPFVDFVQYQMPRISSGEAFFWIDMPPAIAINYGIHGFLGRLKLLGILDTTRATASIVSSVYGLLLIVLAFCAGRTLLRTGSSSHEEGRLAEAQLWLALLNLGSFRSPFVPDAYALMGTLWLLTLIAAGQSIVTNAHVVAFAAMAIAFSVVLDGFLPMQPPLWVVAATLVIQLTAFALNGWILMRTIVARPYEREIVPAGAIA